MIKKCLFILFTNFIVNFCLLAQEDQVKFVGDRVYDFGAVENWNNPKAKFIIKNTGFKPFMFLHAYYEEDLKIEFTPEMVYPGEETEVFATYFTIEKGNFNRDFKLSASTTSKPLTLTIKGNIKSFSPNALTVCPRINNEDKKEKKDYNEFLNYKYTIRFLDKETKNPIHDAKITISAQNGEKLKLETNKKGEVDFNAINGTYSIIGLKDDYKMLKDDLSINANSNESVMYLTPLDIAKANNYSIEKGESKIIDNNNKQVKTILKAFDSETKEKLANVKIYIQGKKGESVNIETGRNGEEETLLKPDAYIITAIKQGYNLLKVNEIIDNNNNEVNLYLNPFELISNKVNSSKEKDRENELKMAKNQEAINKQNADRIEREREQAQKQAEREREMKADAQKEKLEQAKRDRENELKMAKAEQAEELERQKKLNELKIKQAKEANEIALKQAEKEAKIEQERQEKLAEQKAEYEKKQLEREQKMNESIANRKLDYMITVIDEDTNAPIVDAEVKIVKPNGDKTSENTNKKGVIDISGKAGNYSISIMKLGYNFVQKNIGFSETEAVKQIFVKAIKNNNSNSAQPMLSFSNTIDNRPKTNDYSKKVDYDKVKSEIKPEEKDVEILKNETQPIQNNENIAVAIENEKLKLELEKLKMEKENLRLKNELEQLKNENLPLSNKNEIKIETNEQQETKPEIAISTKENAPIINNKEIYNNEQTSEKKHLENNMEIPDELEKDEVVIQKTPQAKTVNSTIEKTDSQNSKPKKQIVTDEFDFFNAIAENKVEIDTNSSLRIRPQMIPKLNKTLYGDNNVLLLIDISKSMKDEGKFNMLKTSLKNLIGALRDVDNIGIIAFNERVKIISEPKSAGNTAYFFDVIDTLNANGRTFGVQGIEKAYEFVQQKFILGGNNQIIVATDGAFNGPNYSEERLNNLIQQYAEQGIKMSILGFNVEQEDESLIEKIAKKGKGNYLKVKNPKQAESILIDEIKFQSKKP